VTAIEIPASALARSASDHLPLVAELRIPAAEDIRGWKTSPHCLS
jgi:hypothetical protein